MRDSVLIVRKARSVLEAPLKFGDDAQIAAVHLLELLHDATALNGGKTDFELTCPTCDGTGDFDCECGKHHDCPCCGGSGSNFTHVDHLDRTQLAQIIDELRAERKAA